MPSKSVYVTERQLLLPLLPVIVPQEPPKLPARGNHGHGLRLLLGELIGRQEPSQDVIPRDLKPFLGLPALNLDLSLYVRFSQEFIGYLPRAALAVSSANRRLRSVAINQKLSNKSCLTGI